jgi:Protein of unknown function (DUF2851)
MTLAANYQRIRPQHTRVAEDWDSSARVPELELQARFFAGDFGRHFKTVDGEAVEIVQLGVWNREAGPDFALAAVSFNGGDTHHGCIEFDIDVRDWERHKHAVNPEYDSVILHVFTRAGLSRFYTRTSNNRNVPQVQVDLSALGAERLTIVPLAKPGRCMAPLKDLRPEEVNSVLNAAAEFRLQNKAAGLQRISAVHGIDEALYQALATTLGYKSNKLPFVLLAQRLPLKFLRDNLDDVDALLFGVSNFLNRDLSELASETRSYLRSMWEKWWCRRSEFDRLILPSSLWKASGQRPANHPQRRVAALVQIVRQWPKIRALTKKTEPEKILNFFQTLEDDYWSHHYTLNSKPVTKPLALVGRSRAMEMLANVFFPWALLRQSPKLEEYTELPGVLTNRAVDTAATRLFGHPLQRLSLAHQQALLQIYEDFCMHDDSDCSQCLFPQQLAQWR